MDTRVTGVGGSAVASDDVVDLFQRRMRRIWERDEVKAHDPDGLSRLMGILLSEEGPASPTGAEVLERSGVRGEWNRVFATERSRALAAWVGPHLVPPVLDVLGGDFTVLRALTDRGLDAGECVGCERRAAYDTDWDSLPFPVHDVPHPLALPHQEYRTALVCTVLHHETDLQRLLDELAAGPAERWVVVENARDDQNSEAFHLFVDEFFNRCLNTFDVPCVPQHRTVAEWSELLGGYGTVRFAGAMEDVPGMPFPYQMFIVDRPGGGRPSRDAT